MTTTRDKRTPEEVEYARERLREIFPIGSRVGTVLLVGKGMRDYVEVFGTATYNGLPETVRVTWTVAKAAGHKHRESGIPMDGTGYCKANEVVMDLSEALYGDSRALHVDRLLTVRR